MNGLISHQFAPIQEYTFLIRNLSCSPNQVREAVTVAAL